MGVFLKELVENVHLDPSGTRKGLQDRQEELHSPFVPWLSHGQQTTHPSAVAMPSDKAS